MSARILEGKVFAQAFREDAQKKAAELHEQYGVQPGLAVIIVGSNPASQVYVRNKHKSCEALGIYSEVIEMPETTTKDELIAKIDALTAAGCYRVFVDTISGSLDHRPELTKLMDQLRPGDTLVVWRLDRLGRSIRHLIDQLQILSEQGVGFRSLQETIDTTSSGGRLVFHVFAALAEFERDLIRERTNAGLAAARARGRKGGRPPALSPDQVKAARRMYEQNEMTVAQIGAVLGVSRATIYRALNRNSAPMVQPRQSRSAV